MDYSFNYDSDEFRKALENLSLPNTGYTGFSEMYETNPFNKNFLGPTGMATVADVTEEGSQEAIQRNAQLENKIAEKVGNVAEAMNEGQQQQAAQISSQGSTIEANKEKQMAETSKQASQAHQQQLKEQQEGLGLVKFALNFIPGWGQAINAIDDISTGNYLGAIMNGVGAANGFNSSGGNYDATSQPINGESVYGNNELFGMKSNNFFPMKKNYF